LGSFLYPGSIEPSEIMLLGGLKAHCAFEVGPKPPAILLIPAKVLIVPAKVSALFASVGSRLPAMHLREVFATNLRRWRHTRGLSQDDLAYEAGVSRSYLSQLEKGVFYASLKVIGRLAEALEVEPAELLRMPSQQRKSD
jgi:DNA-binding XRE family transcriptional regulator